MFFSYYNDGRNVVAETILPCDQYTLQCEEFSRAVRGEISVPYGVDDAVMNMRVIDALFRSERLYTKSREMRRKPGHPLASALLVRRA